MKPLSERLKVDLMPDEKDFVAFMRQNQKQVYRLAFHLLGNEEDAKDATQEVFMSDHLTLQE